MAGFMPYQFERLGASPSEVWTLVFFNQHRLYYWESYQQKVLEQGGLE